MVPKAQRGHSKLELPRWHISALIPVDTSVSMDVWVFGKPRLACPHKVGSKDQRNIFVPDEAGLDISAGELDLWQTLTGCQGKSAGMGLIQGRGATPASMWLTVIPTWVCPPNLNACFHELWVEPADKCAVSKSCGATSTSDVCLALSTALEVAEIHR